MPKAIINKPAMAEPTPMPILALIERLRACGSSSMSSSSPMPSIGLSASRNMAMIV